MKIILRSIIAGFIATVVLSVLMLIKQMMGMMPELNPITDLTHLGATYANLPEEMMTGWILHFLIGSVAWGVLYALFTMRSPNISNVMRGVLVGLVAWLLMMLILMPILGLGLFAVNAGMQVAVMTLVLHLIFGIVLGWTYSKLP